MIIHISPEKCTGCLACQVFCSLVHEGQIVPHLSRIRVLRSENGGPYLPVVCPPCDEKPCIQVCPEPNAIQLTREGIVIIHEAYCTGCSKCIHACPLGAISFHRLPGRGKHGKAVALKCDHCGGDPLCVKTCSMGALIVMQDSESMARDDLERLRALHQQMEASPASTKIDGPRRSR